MGAAIVASTVLGFSASPAFALPNPEGPTGNELPIILDATSHPAVIGWLTGDEICTTNGTIGGQSESGTGWDLQGGTFEGWSYQWSESIGGGNWVNMGGYTSQCITTSGAGPHEAVAYIATVTLTTNEGYGSSSTFPKGPFVADLETYTVQPTVSSIDLPPEVGTAVCSTNGTWSTPGEVIAYGYQWYAVSYRGILAIPGATAACFTPTTTYLDTVVGIDFGDANSLGYTLTVAVAADSSFGLSNYVYASNSTLAVETSGSPSNTVLPTIVDEQGHADPHVGDQLCATNGSWTPPQTNYGYQWGTAAPSENYTGNELSQQCITVGDNELGYPFGLAVDGVPATSTGPVLPRIVSLAQSVPTTVLVANGSPYSGNLSVSNAIGTVSYVETTSTDSPDVVVSSSGAISASSSLATGTYIVSGTDSDTNSDAGSWSFSLTVSTTNYPLLQGSPTSATIAYGTGATTFQLSVPQSDGSMTYYATNGYADFGAGGMGGLLQVYSSIPPGTYTLNGTDFDHHLPSPNTGTWTFTLTVTPPPALVQTSVTSAEVAIPGIYNGNLSVSSNAIGNVTYAETISADSSDITVSPSGQVNAAFVPTGTYIVSGTDADTSNAIGTWSFTLIVDPLIQDYPPTAYVAITNGYNGQVGVFNWSGSSSVTFTEALSAYSSDIVVDANGFITASSSLPIGQYTVTGTDSDSVNDTGTWTFTLVVYGPLIQAASSLSGSVPDGLDFTGNLSVDVAPTPVTFVEDTSSYSGDIVVDANGNISSTALPPGDYVVTGEDSDVNGDTGTWTFDLTVGPAAGTLNQGSPVMGAAMNGAGFASSLSVTNNVGTVTYEEDPSADSSLVVVSSSGAISAATSLAPGTYMVGGSDADTNDDTGTWSFALTVSAPIAQSITFTSPVPTGATVGGSSFAVTATGGASGNAVTFTSGTPSVCTVAGSTVSFIAAGSCTIDADQAGNANYSAASPAQQSVAVALAVIPPVTAPPPVGVPSAIFGTPASTTTSSNAPTTLIETQSPQVSATVSVPEGALPSGTTVSVYPVTNTTTLAASVPPGQTYILSFAVSWQAPDGTSPTASTPITMTISDPGILTGDTIYEVTSSGLTAVGVATQDGIATITFSNDPTFLIAATPKLSLVKTVGTFESHGIVLELNCQAGVACEGTATLSVLRDVKHGKKLVLTRVTLANATISLGANSNRNVVFNLTGTGRAIFAKQPSFKEFRMSLMTVVTGAVMGTRHDVTVKTPKAKSTS